MTHLLPPQLFKLFAPRPPLIHAPPIGPSPDVTHRITLTGVGSIFAQLKAEAAAKEEKRIEAGGVEDEDEQKEGEEEGEEGEVKGGETAGFTLCEEEKRKVRREERKKRKEEGKKGEANYKPSEDPEAVGDPYKTLFISRLSKKATEVDVRREFEMYGAIERVRIVRDKKGHSRGYAFVVYERERDMKAAYKDAENIPILSKNIRVDVERGRTVKGWKPARLGGGLGGKPKPIVEAVAPAFGMMGGGGFMPRGGGGFRGGFRGGGGGFRGGFNGGDRGGGGMGGGFRGGFNGGGGDRGGFGGGGFRGGFNDRGGGGGGFGGDRGGYGGGDRGGGGFGGGGGDRGGYGGGDRGGFQPRGGDSGYGGDRGGSRGGFGGAPRGGGPGGGIGYQQGSFNGGGPPPSGPSAPGGGPDGGPPGGGYKRDFDGGATGAGGYGGGDAKRPRY